MRNLLFILSSEKKMLRDYALTASLIVIGAFAIAQTIAHFTQSAYTLRQPTPEQQASASRTYTVTRSILDDKMTTGSINDLNRIKVEPCGK